ncbi:SigB/SigF/SigG family RNA polymerase sigma factor [Actinacidiphila glaucinigra]|uniref:SigB/SigF/SigG family RNA polymerase sigma factor n=1 Tax=Actinacidiphila glaucinigra TaxID=235986 RepID=UPI002E35AFD5|nr:SigB/SigF/SigG family RNA polymerase sigma factor [Actinacidiphila glaucinigra]
MAARKPRTRHPHPHSPPHPPPGARTRPHEDAPDTAEAQRRIAALPEGPEKEALREQVVIAWIPMSERLARRFRHRGESAEDLRQVAALGLVKAVRRYDPARGSAFESFAVPTIVGEVKRHFRDHMWGVHVPRRVQELRSRVRTVRHELLGTRGRTPTVAEIAAHARMSEEDVLAAMEALDSFAPASLDFATPGAEGRTFLDTLGSEDPCLDFVVDRVAVAPRLRELPPRERQILYLRFFRDMTQNQIADQLGLSQMHVSRLITRTCRRLREEVEAAGRTGDAGPAPGRGGRPPAAAGPPHSPRARPRRRGA